MRILVCLLSLVLPFSALAQAHVLTQVGTIEVSVEAGFKGEDHIKVDGSSKAKISLLSNEYIEHFGKKVEQASKATLRLHSVSKRERVADVRAELGDKVETTLGQLWSLLLSGAFGDPGKPEAYGVSFFIRDDKGKLWPVHVVPERDTGCWMIIARDEEDIRIIPPKGRVASR